MSRLAVLALGAAALGGVASAELAGGLPLVVYNGSASAPVGLYRRAAGEPRPGDFALVRSASAPARAAAGRGYLPEGIPLVKRVAAAAGDTVCRIGAAVLVNGRPVAHALAHDSAGGALPVWEGCALLGPGRVLLLQDHPRSFDGRYLGPVSRDALAGRLVRLGPAFPEPPPEDSGAHGPR